MPLSRYQIRNEFSLADPELYRAADKDDPEALLEGVAMAGLVGVLRQLGDLAEFAAEIFHDLHEEVMATAARGHSLTVKVQQLEAEFPLIERAFLSQTNHSSFVYNAGTDWHPNLRMDQNMVTREDLPRFIMDSYEECRGPPRLFLLDKFDVAGAGACLKRYTDPSFFKVETSSFEFTTSDFQREKKARKAKKRGTRWRNGETPEVLPASHAKLHQLFLEERIENSINVPAHRVKLKRKLNGFPFDSRTGKSYMNKFLETSSLAHKIVHDVCIDSSPLRLTSTDAYESGMDIEEIRPLSPHKEITRRNWSASSSPALSEEINVRRPCLDVVNEDPSLNEILEISVPSRNSQSTDTLPTTSNTVDEKEIAVDGERRIEGSFGYESDDIASEIDNYVDALTTMDSEDTDSELKAKNDLHFSKKQVLDLSSNSENLQAQSSDSHSMENSTLSDDGNSSSKKEISSFSCSDSPSASVESVPLESEVSSKDTKIAYTSYDQQSFNEETQLPRHPENADSEQRCIMVAGAPCGSCDTGEPTTTLSVTDSVTVPKHAYAGIFVEGEGISADTNEMVFTHDESENLSTSIAEDAANLHASPPCARVSVENELAIELVDENLSPGDNLSSALNPSDVPVTPEIQHENELDDDHMNQLHNFPFTSKLRYVPRVRQEPLSSDNPHLHNLDDKDPSTGEESTNLHNLLYDPSSKEDDTSPSVLTLNHLDHLDGLDDENSTVISNASVHMPNILGASEKDCGKHLLHSTSREENAEDTSMKQSHNLITTEIEADNADEEHEETCGAFDNAVISSEQRDLNKNRVVDGTEVLHALNLQMSEITHDFQSLESAEVEISCSRKEYNVELSSETNSEEKGSIVPSELLCDDTSTGLISSSHLESLMKDPSLSNETKTKIDKSDVTDETASLAASAVQGDKHDLCSSLDLENLSEQSLSLIGHSSQRELELGHVHLPDSHEESGTMRKLDKQMSDSPDSNTVLHDTASDHPELELLDSLFEKKLLFDSENTLDLSNTAPSAEQESSLVASSTEDASCLPTVSLEEERFELKHNQLNEELLDEGNTSSDQSLLIEQMQPSSHSERVSDASSKSLLANIPCQDTVSNVLANSSNQDTQPSSIAHCAEERAGSTTNEHDKQEVLDSGEADSEPLSHLAQPQQFDYADLVQCAEASSISLPTDKTSQPSLPGPLSQDEFSSLPIHHHDKEEVELACKDLDKEGFTDETEAKVELVPQFEEAHLSNHIDSVGALDAFSIPFLANFPSQPSVSELLPLSSHNINPFEQNGNSMTSISPGFVLLPGAHQIDLLEMPPLPPLPPAQWRMGKIQHASPAHDRESTPDHTGAILPSLASKTDQNAQILNQNVALSGVSTESTERIYARPTDNVAQSGPLTLPPTILPGNSRVTLIDPVNKRSTNPFFPLPGQNQEMLQPSLHTVIEGETQPVNSILVVTTLDTPSTSALGSTEKLIQLQNQVAPEMYSEERGSARLEGDLPTSNGVKPKASPLDIGSTDASKSLCHEPSQPQPQPQPQPQSQSQSQHQSQSQSQHQPLHQLVPQTSLNEFNLEQNPTSSDGNVVTGGTVTPSPYTENQIPEHTIPTSEREYFWPAVEDGNPNGIRTVKLQRPRTPLIDDLAAHDITKLRKVTDRVRPQIEKVDERDTLLEQIRAKTFNLKPPVVTRPSIQGPQTNLRVAAILEKAKTIRQAFAGSDEEDDEDSWSDS